MPVNKSSCTVVGRPWQAGCWWGQKACSVRRCRNGAGVGGVLTLLLNLRDVVLVILDVGMWIPVILFVFACLSTIYTSKLTKILHFG